MNGIEFEFWLMRRLVQIKFTIRKIILIVKTHTHKSSFSNLTFTFDVHFGESCEQTEAGMNSRLQDLENELTIALCPFDPGNATQQALIKKLSSKSPYSIYVSCFAIDSVFYDSNVFIAGNETFPHQAKDMEYDSGSRKHR